MAMNDLELQEQPEIDYADALPTSSQFVFGLATFTSAFLLFQVQLILAKFLLPWFGGTSAVWTSCLLFFQLFLLVGYSYSHKISTSFSLNQQGCLHLAFLAISVVWIFCA